MIAPSAEQIEKVRDHLCRLAKLVTKATDPEPFAFQVVRRDRENGDIEYQIFAGTKKGTQIAWVQSSRHDAEFIAACLAQAPLFADFLASQSRALEEAQRERDDWKRRAEDAEGRIGDALA